MADQHKNFAYSKVVTAPVGLAGTSLTVTAGTGSRYPTPPFNATVWPAAVLPLNENAEIVRVTNIFTDTLTIERAQEGTTAKTMATGWQIAATVTAKVLGEGAGPLNVKAIGEAEGVAAGGDYSAAVTKVISGLTNFTLYFPAGTYKLNLGELGKEEAGKGVSVRFVGDGPNATTLEPVDATHTIASIVGPADSTNEGTCFEGINWKIPAHREYVGAFGTGHPLIILNFCRAYRIERCRLDAEEHEGTFIAAESAYNMHIEDFEVIHGKYVVPFAHTNSQVQPNSASIAQCDNFHFQDCVWASTMGPVFRNASNELHHVRIDGLKVVQTGWYPEGGTFFGTLEAEALTGATTFKYAEASTSKPAVGDFVVIGNDGEGHSADFGRVTEVVEAERKVTLSQALKFTHLAGAPALNGGIALSVGDGAHLVELFNPHFEGHTPGLAIGKVAQVDIYGYEMACAYGVYYCGSTVSALYVHGGWTQAGTKLANELWKKSADNPGGGLGAFAMDRKPFVPVGALTAQNAPPSSVPYMWEFADEQGGNNPTIRKNVNTGGNNPKARLWQGTLGNAEKFKVQAAGRGYFADTLAVGDLGEIHGKNSAEIDALLTISPTDATSVGTLIASAHDEGKQYLLKRATGVGNKWFRTAELTEIP